MLIAKLSGTTFCISLNKNDNHFLKSLCSGNQIYKKASLEKGRFQIGKKHWKAEYGSSTHK